MAWRWLADTIRAITAKVWLLVAECHSNTRNNSYSEFVVTPAIMMGMENLILDRIAFGSVKELEDLYNT